MISLPPSTSATAFSLNSRSYRRAYLLCGFSIFGAFFLKAPHGFSKQDQIHPKKGLVGALRAWANLKCEMGEAKFLEWELVVAGWDQGGHEAGLKGLCSQLGLRIADRGGLRRDGAQLGARSAEQGDVNLPASHSSPATTLPSPPQTLGLRKELRPSRETRDERR
ncbi:MAG: hypothetical protein ACKOAS_08800, partial [Verrucomicrobiota bacterium]